MSDVSAKKSARFWRRLPIFIRLFIGLVALLVIGSVVFVVVPSYRQKTVVENLKAQWGSALIVDFDDPLPGWRNWFPACECIIRKTMCANVGNRLVAESIIPSPNVERQIEKQRSQ
jgi:hypothetical protein